MSEEFENDRIFLRQNIFLHPHVNTKMIRKHLHLQEASFIPSTSHTYVCKRYLDKKLLHNVEFEKKYLRSSKEKNKNEKSV